MNLLARLFRTFTKPAVPTGPLAEAESLLGLPAGAFAGVLASGSLRPLFGYREYKKPKRHGGTRAIAEPDERLKRVQRWIAERYLQDAPHAAATAYRPGRSIAHHVWPHAGAAWVVAADVEEFFPSTQEGRVARWWDERTDAATARLLTTLTTWRGALPQGAPTSPGLSNLLNVELDEAMSRRAAGRGARYTRYCDDLLFSWPGEAGPPSDFEATVRAVLHEYGYRLRRNEGLRVLRPRDEPEVTGLVLTRRGVRLPDRITAAMRRLKRGSQLGDWERLAGYRGYAAMVQRRPDGA